MEIKSLNTNINKQNVAVISSRSFDSYGLLCRFIITRILPKRIRCIISRGAKRADSLAERFAQEYHCDIKSFPLNDVYMGQKPDSFVIMI